MEEDLARSAGRPKRTIRNVLIEPFKQIKLGLYVMCVTIAFVAVAGYFYKKAFTEQYTHVMEIFGVVEEATQEEVVVNDIFLKNRIQLGVVFVFFVGLMFFVIFRSTHKYYGPLVSIERFVRNIQEGNYDQRVSIRRGDELGRLVGLLNDMATELEERHGPRVGSTAQRQDDQERRQPGDHDQVS